jgi:hypothetical protein
MLRINPFRVTKRMITNLSLSLFVTTLIPFTASALQSQGAGTQDGTPSQGGSQTKPDKKPDPDCPKDQKPCEKVSKERLSTASAAPKKTDTAAASAAAAPASAEYDSSTASADSSTTTTKKKKAKKAKKPADTESPQPAGPN